MVRISSRIPGCTALYPAGSQQCYMALPAEQLHSEKRNMSSIVKNEDVSLFFREPPLDCLDWRTASTTNKGHGRVENRMITVSTELNDFLARDWHEVGQVFCLRSASNMLSSILSNSCMGSPTSNSRCCVWIPSLFRPFAC